MSATVTQSPTAEAIDRKGKPSQRSHVSHPEAARGPAHGRSGLASAIYEGTVYHRRTEPLEHAFSYPMFMPLFDLDELPELLDGIPLWSARRAAPAHFCRRDYLGPDHLPLAEAARNLVAERLGSAPDGPVRLLANPRYWGIGINPVAFYYLHGSGPGEPVEAIIAEVTNTPWGQRRSYVLEPGRDAAGLSGEFGKRLHVSPFMPLEQTYRWSANEPGELLRFKLANHEGGREVFQAGVDLRRRDISRASMARLLVRYPPATAATLARIYWNAVKLKLKGAPYFSNPSKGRPR
jgi:uncharacterized protein